MAEPPPRAQPLPAADARLTTASTKGAATVARPGLQNEAGEYNCFLNVIIQCLWHCSAFRAWLLSCPPHFEHGDALALSLQPSLCCGFIGSPLPEHHSPHSCLRAGICFGSIMGVFLEDVTQACGQPGRIWPFLAKLQRRNCVAPAADRKVAALLSIFRKFAAHEAAERGADAELLAERVVVDPAQLRTALSTSVNFQLGAARQDAFISSSCVW